MGNCLLTGTKTIWPIGSVYMSVYNTNPSTYFGGTWTLISSVALASEHVFGNGKGLEITDGTNINSLDFDSNVGYTNATDVGKNVGSAISSGGTFLSSNKILGVPTLIQLGNNPEYSGLVADTITVYTFKRVS